MLEIYFMQRKILSSDLLPWFDPPGGQSPIARLLNINKKSRIFGSCVFVNCCFSHRHPRDPACKIKVEKRNSYIFIQKSVLTVNVYTFLHTQLQFRR